MYKLFTALCLLILSCVGVFAQSQARNDFGSSKNNPFESVSKPVVSDSKTEEETPNPTSLSPAYRKNEFYVGYSNQQIDEFGRTGFHDIQGAYTRNVTRYLGIRADISYARNDRTFVGTLFDPVNGSYTFQQQSKRTIAQFLGGVQIKDNASTRRFKPFGYALAGVAVNTAEFKNLACTSSNCPANIPLFNNFKFTDTGLAGAFGGGLDIKVTEKIDFRAIQFDYNPIYSNSRVDNNFRIGIGIVFR
jgi:hypothetical protein